MPADPNSRSDRKLRRVRRACCEAVNAVATGGIGAPGLARLMVLLTGAIQTLGLPGQGRPLTLSQLLAARERAGAELDGIARRAITDAPDASMGPQVHVLRDELVRILETPLPAQVQTIAGPVEATALLEAVTLESCAIGLANGAAMPRTSLIAASRSLAGVLGERHGGRTIEMRVPPATAVQLEAFGQGPNHHRGTPPNVAETDPATFVQLATGLATWDQVRAEGRIQASGSHVDAMARMLPVIDLSGQL